MICTELLGYTQLTECINKSWFIRSLAFRFYIQLWTSCSLFCFLKNLSDYKLSVYTSQSYAYAMSRPVNNIVTKFRLDQDFLTE